MVGGENGMWGLQGGLGGEGGLGGQRDSRKKKIYTMQRVNGNGGNGKGDGVPGPHQHSLEESDRVKKNSVLRWMMKVGRENKKKVVQQVSFYLVFDYFF